MEDDCVHILRGGGQAKRLRFRRCLGHARKRGLRRRRCVVGTRQLLRGGILVLGQIRHLIRPDLNNNLAFVRWRDRHRVGVFVVGHGLHRVHRAVLDRHHIRREVRHRLTERRRHHELFRIETGCHAAREYHRRARRVVGARQRFRDFVSIPRRVRHNARRDLARHFAILCRLDRDAVDLLLGLAFGSGEFLHLRHRAVLDRYRVRREIRHGLAERDRHLQRRLRRVERFGRLACERNPRRHAVNRPGPGRRFGRIARLVLGEDAHRVRAILFDGTVERLARRRPHDGTRRRLQRPAVGQCRRILRLGGEAERRLLRHRSVCGRAVERKVIRLLRVDRPCVRGRVATVPRRVLGENARRVLPFPRRADKRRPRGIHPVERPVVGERVRVLRRGREGDGGLLCLLSVRRRAGNGQILWRNRIERPAPGRRRGLVPRRVRGIDACLVLAFLGRRRERRALVRRPVECPVVGQRRRVFRDGRQIDLLHVRQHPRRARQDGLRRRYCVDRPAPGRRRRRVPRRVRGVDACRVRTFLCRRRERGPLALHLLAVERPVVGQGRRVFRGGRQVDLLRIRERPVRRRTGKNGRRRCRRVECPRVRDRRARVAQRIRCRDHERVRAVLCGRARDRLAGSGHAVQRPAIRNGVRVTRGKREGIPPFRRDRTRCGRAADREIGGRREVQRAGNLRPFGRTVAGHNPRAKAVRVFARGLADGRPGIPYERTGRGKVLEGNRERLADPLPGAVAKPVRDLGRRPIAPGRIEERERERDRSVHLLFGLPVGETGRQGEAARGRHGRLVRRHEPIEVPRDEAERVLRLKVENRRRNRLRLCPPGFQRLPDVDDVRHAGARRDADCVFRSLGVDVFRGGVAVGCAHRDRRLALLDNGSPCRDRRVRMAGRRVHLRARLPESVRSVNRRLERRVRRTVLPRPGCRTLLRPAGRDDIPRRRAADGQLHLVRGDARNRRPRHLRQRRERERRRRQRLPVHVLRRNRNRVVRIRCQARRQFERARHPHLRVRVQPLERRVVGPVEVDRQAGDAGLGVAVQGEADSLRRHRGRADAAERVARHGERVRAQVLADAIRALDNPIGRFVDVARRRVVREVARFAHLRGVGVAIGGIVVDGREVRHRVARQERPAPRRPQRLGGQRHRHGRRLAVHQRQRIGQGSVGKGKRYDVRDAVHDQMQVGRDLRHRAIGGGLRHDIERERGHLAAHRHLDRPRQPRRQRHVLKRDAEVVDICVRVGSILRNTEQFNPKLRGIAEFIRQFKDGPVAIPLPVSIFRPFV